ncbi:MAG: hypothetical protein DRQ61_05275 [Gammaproteobacteria bacterium]|nr:MAG: hypothetical protein DRQ61_05275 [Gammaproteobacteria bacterium]
MGQKGHALFAVDSSSGGLMVKYFPVFLFILSIGFLVPGLTKPLMTIEAAVDKKEMLGLAAEALSPPDQSNSFIQNMLQSVVQQLDVEGSVVVFRSTRSLLGTMSELISHDHVVVGVLIGLFGVVIPLVKILLTMASLFLKTQKSRMQLLKVSAILGKWSMSDVFTMAVIVTFLAINANEYAINSVQMNAKLGVGFYFFMTYCLLAIGASQLMEWQWSRSDKSEPLPQEQP